MYRIKFPSGEVATIESPEALTDAVRNGSVTSYCFILHERSGQWLPIVRHPHYHQALTARAAAVPGAADAAVPAILPDPLEAPPAAAAKGASERSTQASLDVPDLDTLLELTDTPAAADAATVSGEPLPQEGTSSVAPARARGRSRELEFLYVPEARSAGQPRTPPRTAGPPPRPAAATPSPAPKAGPQPSPAPAPAPAPAATPRNVTPKAEAPSVPRPEPVAPQPEPVAPQPEPVTPRPEPVMQRAEPDPRLAAEESAAPVATLAPPVRRGTERYDYDLVDPVEAALNFDGPPPIELSDLRPRHRAPGGSRRLFIAAGLAVVLGGGLLTWSPWSGEPAEVAAVSPAPSGQAERGDEAPAGPALDMETPAEEEPAFDIYSMPADDPSAARTSFGGTAAQAGVALPELREPAQGVLPRAPKELRVAVPVVGGGADLDSLRLAQVKRAITE